MVYDYADYLPKAEYAKKCKAPKGCIKLYGASYVRIQTVDESYDILFKQGKSGCVVNTLVSYDTAIMDVCEELIIVNHAAFSYSRTTCRHISMFLRKYVKDIDYHTLKKIVGSISLLECVVINGYVVTAV